MRESKQLEIGDKMNDSLKKKKENFMNKKLIKRIKN